MLITFYFSIFDHSAVFPPGIVGRQSFHSSHCFLSVSPSVSISNLSPPVSCCLSSLHITLNLYTFTDYGLESQGIESRRGREFLHFRHANNCNMYTRSFRETERPERGAEYTTSSAEVQKVLELYLRFPSPSAYACREATLNFKLTY